MVQDLGLDGKLEDVADGLEMRQKVVYGQPHSLHSERHTADCALNVPCPNIGAFSRVLVQQHKR